MDQNDALRNAACGVCDRPLPPHGDCYGCEADKVTEQLAEVERLLNDLRTSAAYHDLASVIEAVNAYFAVRK